jgi:hypothetical protein
MSRSFENYNVYDGRGTLRNNAFAQAYVQKCIQKIEVVNKEINAQRI